MFPKNFDFFPQPEWIRVQVIFCKTLGVYQENVFESLKSPQGLGYDMFNDFCKRCK